MAPEIVKSPVMVVLPVMDVVPVMLEAPITDRPFDRIDIPLPNLASYAVTSNGPLNVLDAFTVILSEPESPREISLPATEKLPDIPRSLILAPPVTPRELS